MRQCLFCHELLEEPAIQRCPHCGQVQSLNLHAGRELETPPHEGTLVPTPTFSLSSSLLPSTADTLHPWPDASSATIYGGQRPPSQGILPARRGLSRRKVIMDMLGVVGLAAAGGGIAWLLQPRSSPLASARPHPLVPMLTYRGWASAVTSVTWSPDETRIASGYQEGGLRIWNAATGQTRVRDLGDLSRLLDLAWSPDGTRLVAVGDFDPGEVLELATGVTQFRCTEGAFAAAWSPNGTLLATGGAGVQIWDGSTGSRRFTYTGHTVGTTDQVWAVAWSPDGQYLASGGSDKTAQVWEAATGKHVITYRGHTDAVVGALAWSPDSQRVASASGFTGTDPTVQVWEALTGQRHVTYRGHTDSVASLAWAPQGHQIASGSWDATVQVWDATTGGQAFTYHGHASLVTAVAWSPLGKRIASGSGDQTVQVWQPPA